MEIGDLAVKYQCQNQELFQVTHCSIDPKAAKKRFYMLGNLRSTGVIVELSAINSRP